ncbi:redox-regulated ATPase YchF, partial [Listeria monocytogenes]|nr:redox-regulated ATPase YchF [Listeria monocytogenes]
EAKIVRNLFLLTRKPVLYVANVSEEDVSSPDDNKYVHQVREFAASENSEVIVVCARAEEEIAELEDEDKLEFLEALGFEESGVDQLIRSAYTL